MTIQLQPRGRLTEITHYVDATEEIKTLCLNCVHRDDETDAWCERFQRTSEVYKNRIAVVECGGHTPCN
jgi:hypothetical protein